MAGGARNILQTQQQYFLQITVAEQSAQASQEQQFWVCAMSICRKVQDCCKGLPEKAGENMLSVCFVVLFPNFLWFFFRSLYFFIIFFLRTKMTSSHVRMFQK